MKSDGEPTYFLSDISGFDYLFDPYVRSKWSYGSVKPCEFDDGVVNLYPGACLVTSDREFQDFVVKGDVCRYKGKGPVLVGFRHGKRGVYTVVFGQRCGVVYNRGGDCKVKRLWTAEGNVSVSEWTPFEIAVRDGVLYVTIDSISSGPIKNIEITKTEIFIKAEGCHAGFRNLVGGKRRKKDVSVERGNRDRRDA